MTQPKKSELTPAIPSEQISIAEGLVELKRIKSVLELRSANIRRYSSKRKGAKDAIEKQAEFVKSEAQSARDLIKRYATIKMTINKTNLATRISYKNYDMSVAEAILFKHLTHGQISSILDSYNDETARTQIVEQQRILSLGSAQRLNVDQLETLQLLPELFYNPRDIMRENEENLDFLSHLDFLIDATNHRTMITI